jgi:Toxin co-regulated pilus biosynthesis protein Q
MIIMPTRHRASLIARVFALLSMTGLATASFAQSQLTPPAGDGWQLLSGAPSSTVAMATPPASALGNAPSPYASMPPTLKVAAEPTQAVATPAVAPASRQASTVAAVVLPEPTGSSAPGSVLTFAITPQDINLRSALDRWLQQQGWQLAWKIDDDLPLEFNATFSGDFDSVLTQVMRATNHMRTPTRMCEHTNNVIRVVARAANCQD